MTPDKGIHIAQLALGGIATSALYLGYPMLAGLCSIWTGVLGAVGWYLSPSVATPAGAA